MTDRPRALAVLIAVFLAGCIVGAGGYYFWLKKTAAPAFQGREIDRPPRGPERQRRPDFLQLTPEQQKRFGEIMAESRKQLDALRNEQAPKFDAIRSETNGKLRAILNEEQKKKFEAFLKEMESRREREPRRRGPEPPP
jgi:hypothetical protein